MPTDRIHFLSHENEPLTVQLNQYMDVAGVVRAVAMLPMDAQFDRVERNTDDPEYENTRILGAGAVLFNVELREVTFTQEQPPRTELLTSAECSILDILTRNPNKLVNAEELTNPNNGSYATLGSLRTHLSTLRKKLRPQDLIRNVHGSGFVFKD